MTKRVLLGLPLALLCAYPAAVDAFAPPKSSALHVALTADRRQDVALFASPAATSNVVLAGKIAPALSKFALNSKMMSKIGAALKKQTNIVDLMFIAFVGWASQPVVRFVYEKFFEKWRKKDWDDTYMHHTWKVISEAARIASIVYAIDCLDIIMTEMGIKLAITYNFGSITASVAYTVWAAKKVAKWKQMYLKRAIRKSEGGNKQGRFFLFNRFGDVIISIVAILAISDKLHLSKSVAFGRFFALGSVGTLALSLAAKGIAEQFVGGLALSTTDKFFEGDMILVSRWDVLSLSCFIYEMWLDVCYVIATNNCSHLLPYNLFPHQLGDGTSGKVVRLGWMSIDLRKSDETIMRIPNSQISNQRITNLSRARLSQVTQTLRVKYTDAEKIPNLLTDIKSQVQQDCPKLITDGSRPCRVHFKEFRDDHIEIGVDFRFRVPVVGDGYHQNKEACNVAIAKAMNKNKLQFALPTAFNYELMLNDYDHFERDEYGEMDGTIN